MGEIVGLIYYKITVTTECTRLLHYKTAVTTCTRVLFPASIRRGQLVRFPAEFQHGEHAEPLQF